MKNKNHRTKPVIVRLAAAMVLIFVFCLVSNFSFAQQVLDKIIALVGDQIILESDLNTQVEMYAAQMRISFKTQKEKDQLKKQLLEQMINDKLLLIAAEKDTLIQVTDKEVDEALQKQMSRVKSEFTDEEFKTQLEAEGLTEIELKKKYREQIANQMMIDRLVASKLQKVSISAKEVRDFFEIYQDSIPDQPEAVKLSHVLLEIKISQVTLDSLKSKAERVLVFAKSGKDFTQLASLYSDDPTSQQGGDLGFFRRGDMIPKFEEVAFSLQPEEISDVIQTEFGFHIIKVEEKQGDRVHARHILFLIRPSERDSVRVHRLADSLHTELLGGADIGEVAKQFSVDEESRKMGGELGWYPVDQMTPEFKQGIQGLQIGEISSPLKGPAGIHILKVLDRKEQRKLSLEEDWDTIKDMVRRKKTNQLVLQWVEKLRQDIYVEIRQ